MKLITKEGPGAFQISRCGFKRFSIFSENLVGVEMVQKAVTLDRPIYIGSAVLNFSKVSEQY